MKDLLRPYRSLVPCLVALAGLAAWQYAGPAAAHAQSHQIATIFVDSSAQAADATHGYLGVDLADVDADRAQALKLKDTHGAVITLIDHDAPAGQIGLRINDVVLQLNGQNIDDADQLRRMLKEVPAGRKVTLVISRDGALQTFAVELVDRKKMEQNVWNKLGSSANDVPQMGILSGDTAPGGFHFPSFGSTLKVGALVEPLTVQMAAYLGVQTGLMVKQVAHKSEAEHAGLRAFDVILKVGTDAIATSADWDRALRSNQGKPVPLTILRDKKQQTLTLQVDSKRHQKGEIQQNDLFPADAEQLTQMSAEIEQSLAEELQKQAEAWAQAAQAQTETLREQMGKMQFDLTQEQAEQLRRQTEKMLECMKNFKVDPKQVEQLQQQMEEFRKSFNPGQFRIDPKQMEEFRHQMEQFRQQMEEWRARAEGRFV